MMLGLLIGVANAQKQKEKNTVPKQQTIDQTLSSYKANRKKHNSVLPPVQTSPTYILTSTSNNKAYSSILNQNNQYQIVDPTIRALNDKANGGDVKISSSGIVGMPKGTYGFAKGHVTFYTAGSTSSGTITGSGSVGTGSTPGSLGTNGSVPDVNGKNPYAGSSIWGTRITGPAVKISDSTVLLRNARHTANSLHQ
jgi:hypothetical protein